ncbi:MAG: 2-(1,2-epoxy-1,2-dihydrophenyl)acetyl-CoA isomerase PaaG [Pseudomonadota bacterium]
MEETVLIDRREGYVALTLNRPERLNAFNETMHAALKRALHDAADDPACRAVLLTGAGRGFCAGQDLADRNPATRSEPVDLARTLDTFFNPLVRQIRALDMPVIAAVNGVAAGAGANVALCCDLILAARSATFIQAFCKIGLLPDAGGTWTLTRRIGEARAKALAMTGVPLTADEAADWGLIWRAVDDDALMDEAHALAASLSAGPTFALALTKQAIHAAATNDFDAQLDHERDAQARAGRTADYAEGVTAFLEKRPARFTGQG